MATSDAEASGPPTALFAPTPGGFVGAPLTRGPWDARMMHGGAPAALLAHAVERVEPGAELAVTRLTIELLGGVPVGEVAVAAQVAKPGRRFQVVDATLDVGGRPACLARAVRLRRADLPDAAASAADLATPLPGPEAGEDWGRFVDRGDEQFYPDATEIRVVGGAPGSGHAIAWVRLRGELLPGVAPSPLARAAAAADFANGLSWILPFDRWLFVNTDLTIHVHREPEGEWIALDARTVSSPCGAGLSTAVLHDRHGPFGATAQSLFVEPR